jgi:hypothetical protein
MEAKGWRFMNLETYTENGDLVGFFVTYVKYREVEGGRYPLQRVRFPPEG